jgi:hypothetical protein
MEAESKKTEELKTADRERYMRASLKDSTRSQYRTPLRVYEEMFGSIGPDNVPDLDSLCTFVRFYGECTELTEQSILKYLSAIKFEMEVKCVKRISMDDHAVIKRLVEGLVKSRKTVQRDPKQAIALPDEAVQALGRLKLSPGTVKDQLRSAALVATIWVLRFDQIPRLMKDDLEFLVSDSEAVVLARFRNTKTEPLETRESSCDERNCTKSFCLTHYLLQRVREADSDPTMFPAVSKRTFVKKFIEMCRFEFTSEKVKLWKIEQLTYHSFRRTGSTLLTMRGRPLEEVRIAGNWRSDTVLSYTREGIKKNTRTHCDLLLGRGQER